MSRRRTAAAVLAVTLLGSVFAVGALGRPARAAGATFDRNMVLSNQVFDATGTLSTAQIQVFLNTFSSSCLKNYTAPVPTGYSSYGTPASAAQVIRSAATLWGVNPQVLLATLEKEQTLVSGGGGCDPWRYWSAMGYNCPDGGGRYNYPDLGITGTCVKREADAGFAAQVNHGAWQLQFNRQRAEGNLDWNGSSSIHNYGFNTAGWRRASANEPSIYYDGWATIDGTAVYMLNGATASLYTYTPHLHGNQAFFDLFTRWFGSVGTPPGTVPATTPGSTVAPPTTVRGVPTTAPPPPPPPPAAGAEVAYVDNLTELLLGRHATDGEKNLWGSYLRQGGSRTRVVSYLVGSVEYTQNLVSGGYQKMLGRGPDQGGLANWTDVILRTGRDDSMFAGLAGSTEYYRDRGQNTDADFLETLYNDILGRGLDENGSNTWTKALAGRSMTRTQVAFAIMQSNEYAGRVVGRAYAQALGRWPDPGGATYWSAGYLRSHRSGDILISIAASPEGYRYLSSRG